MSLRAGTTRADFGSFYEAEFPQVYRAAFFLSGDPDAAFDLAQEAFARAYARWGRLARHEWAGGWVMTTVLNLSRRRLRASKEDPLQDDAAAPATEGAERVDLVHALRGLPFRQRQALVLYYVGDLETAAVARVMDVSEGTVKAHLAQGRAALRRKLEVTG